MNFDVVAVTPIALFEIMISIFLISQKLVVLFLSWLFFITVGISVYIVYRVVDPVYMKIV